ncbi:MAG: hypothetical protein FJ086_17690 [Deltaproteobacteria bacterium]|nr:hypothetical protein [Deltaproteobacteria bacterium]
MKFETRQRIRGTVAEVEQALAHPDYVAFLLQHHGVLLEAQVLEVSDTGGRIQRRVRYRPRPVIRAIGPREVPPEWFAFVETSTYDRARRELQFQNVPTTHGIRKMMLNSGSLRLRELGSECERTIEGEVKLVLPLLLKPLGLVGEKIISSEGLKILDGEVPVLNRFLAEVIRRPAS